VLGEERQVGLVAGAVVELDVERAGHLVEGEVLGAVHRERVHARVAGEAGVRAVPLVHVEVDDAARRTCPERCSRRTATATSLYVQNPSPRSGKAWCVPPARFIATPCCSAASAASQVPRTTR
jgi:hypothetical protein